MAAYIVSYAVIGWDVLWRAVRNICHGQVFDENFLMTLATVGAFLTGEYREAVAVMLFYQVGELFQSYAVGKSRKSIASLMDIRPDSANVEREGQLVEVDPEEVAVGDVIVVKPGERIPIDGVVLEGESSIDTAALTGESCPRDVVPGDDVVSGCVNRTGLLRVRTTKAFGESTVARILEMVENSSAKKAKAENFITRFARWYTPSVVIAAALLAVLPPLTMGGNWQEWLHRALIFLVISCPCALVISVPLSFFGGIGGASRRRHPGKGRELSGSVGQRRNRGFRQNRDADAGRFQCDGDSSRHLLRIAIAGNGRFGGKLFRSSHFPLHSRSVWQGD